jgi:hypothetical protein
MLYKDKYIKYKNKYKNLKKQIGGTVCKLCNRHFSENSSNEHDLCEDCNENNVDNYEECKKSHDNFVIDFPIITCSICHNFNSLEYNVVMCKIICKECSTIEYTLDNPPPLPPVLRRTHRDSSIFSDPSCFFCDKSNIPFLGNIQNITIHNSMHNIYQSRYEQEEEVINLETTAIKIKYVDQIGSERDVYFKMCESCNENYESNKTIYTKHNKKSEYNKPDFISTRKQLENQRQQKRQNKIQENMNKESSTHVPPDISHLISYYDNFNEMDHLKTKEDMINKRYKDRGHKIQKGINKTSSSYIPREVADIINSYGEYNDNNYFNNKLSDNTERKHDNTERKHDNEESLQCELCHFFRGHSDKCQFNPKNSNLD